MTDNSDNTGYTLYSPAERRKLAAALDAIPMEQRIEGVMRFYRNRVFVSHAAIAKQEERERILQP